MLTKATQLFVFTLVAATYVHADFTFVQISDTHTARDKSAYNSRYREVIRQVNELKPAFVIHTGDALELWSPESAAFFKEISKSLAAPMYVVPGNHDLLNMKTVGADKAARRIADWKITFADTVADNGSSAFFVLAKAGLPLAGLDLPGAAMTMSVNGEVASSGVGAAVMGNPLNAAAWLARTLAERGEPLKAGDILLAGALGPMVALKAGDAVVAEVAGIGSCSFTFAGA